MTITYTTTYNNKVVWTKTSKVPKSSWNSGSRKVTPKFEDTIADRLKEFGWVPPSNTKHFFDNIEDMVNLLWFVNDNRDEKLENLFAETYNHSRGNFVSTIWENGGADAPPIFWEMGLELGDWYETIIPFMATMPTHELIKLITQKFFATRNNATIVEFAEALVDTHPDFDGYTVENVTLILKTGKII